MARDEFPSVEPGEAIEVALSAIMRWSTRADNRRNLHDAGGAALSSTDSWLLDRIVTSGPVRMSKLAEWLSVDKSTMTTEVRRLQDAELVARVPDPSDGRAVLVSATEEGRIAIGRHRRVAQSVYGTLVGKWPETDRTELARLLNRFVDELAWVTDAVAAHNESRSLAGYRTE
jgi:DNA-binding MarR family transcriptional regulator